MKGLRDDLKLAAYAVALGYALHDEGTGQPVSPAYFEDDGIPQRVLQFVLGDVWVWLTARGWRVARLLQSGQGLRYEPTTDSQFYKRLKAALDEGVRNWRDR